MVPGLGASGGLAVRTPDPVLEGVLAGVPEGVPGPGAGEVLASSVFAESAPEAAGERGSIPGATCIVGASDEASGVFTSVTTVAAGIGFEVWAGPEPQTARASPGAARVTGAEVAVVTGGPGATTTTGPAREPRGGGEGAAGAP